MWKYAIVSMGLMAYMGCVPCVDAAGKAKACLEQSEKQSEEYRIGVMVKAISAAIQSPKKPESMAVIVKYGTDSRYYVMIRGWLTQELRGVESQLQAVRDAKAKSQFQTKVNFLKKAVRRIDLE